MTQMLKPEEQTTTPRDDNFVEVALRLSGKSEEEARTTGEMDRADDQLEKMFDKKYQTIGSPIHKAVWDDEVDVDLFKPHPTQADEHTQRVMDHSIDVVRRHKAAGTLLNEQNKISQQALQDLAQAGYWGMLVDRSFGGAGAPFRVFSKFLTRMATVDPTVAGLGSVHGCIGAVDPIRAFGNDEQQAQYLPKLANGEKLSGFALTEPAAGSDLTALKTTAVLDGDDYVVNGEKLFITNATFGRTIGLVCKIDGIPAVLIADLPEEENEQFHLVKYGIHALRHSYNNGLVFKDFRVPKKNLLAVPAGDGLTIAYHGLNRGRVALCATAAGTMRLMMANMLPWAKFRRTYGNPIDTRELVQKRIGKLAGMIVAADALVDWTSWLLDEGFRGEMECIIAKIFGSESQKEAAIELFMKTHGGRAFLHGHLFGDYVHEFLAPCIYEGEGEMLGMAFLKSLIKDHGRKYYEPIGKAIAKAGIKNPNPMNPMHAWAIKDAAIPYLGWRVAQNLNGWKKLNFGGMSDVLAEHASYAANELQSSRFAVDGLMQKYQLKLADRQCSMADASLKIQNLVTMLVTALWADAQNNELHATAADVMCQELRQRITGKKLGAKYYRTVTKLGAAIAEGGYSDIAGIDPEPILMKY
ncbi:acyl-CoA dehydrogenase family protein [Lacunimicrobium album]